MPDDTTEDLIALGDTSVQLREIDPVALTHALRLVRERIPGLVQLSLKERQSKANAASLNPDVTERGLHLAAVWKEMKATLGWSADELRAGLDRTRELDELRRELLAMADTVKATSLKEKHDIGLRILQLYKMVGTLLRGTAHDYLLPYYEDLKKAFARAGRKGARKKTADE